MPFLFATGPEQISLPPGGRRKNPLLPPQKCAMVPISCRLMKPFVFCIRLRYWRPPAKVQFGEIFSMICTAAVQASPFIVSLMISQKAKYALRALTALAQADGQRPLLISEIAVQQAIPKKFLEQILLELKRSGIVESRRGKLGGYLLQRTASEITFGEVLRLIDGPIAPLPCLSLTAYRRCEDCDGEKQCEIRHVFARVADASRDVLFSTTIADAVNGTRNTSEKLASLEEA